MSAVDQRFAELRRSGRKALVAFIGAGDPDLNFTASGLAELVSAGCDLCEVGIPYSDPIADGPVIQASYTRALERGFRWRDAVQMFRSVTPGLAVPAVAMVSYAIVHRLGPGRFLDDAKSAGLAGAVVPDLPVEESLPLAQLCSQADFSLIQLVTPTTPRDRAVRIAERSTGFLYYVSVTGITGERLDLPESILENVAWLRGRTPLPICVGFGISQPQQAAQLAQVADGVIVGSAFVRRVAAADQRPRAEVLQELGAMAAAYRQAIDAS
jgi:tryptophan synthase alpha chain